MGQAHAVLRAPRTIDLLIVDIDLASGGGVSLATDARAIFPLLPILFITSRDEDVEDSRQEILEQEFPLPYGVMSLHEAHERLREKHAAAGSHEGRLRIGD